MTKIQVRFNEPFKKSERVRRYDVYCELPEGVHCPFKKRGTCLHNWLTTDCEFKKTKCTHGPTQRAMGYHKFVEDARQEGSTLENRLKDETVPEGMFQIGDRVYLKYSFINVMGINAFMGWQLFKHEAMIVAGCDYISPEHFVPEVIEKLCRWRPRSLIGAHEITDYQRKSVPALLRDLKACRYDLWDQLSDETKARTGTDECKCRHLWEGQSIEEVQLERIRQKLWATA
jgi:hypothetical protein